MCSPRVGGRSALDEAAAAILSGVLKKRGLGAKTLGPEAISAPHIASLAGTTTGEAQGDGALARLIEAARREDQLDVTITSSQGEKGGKELTDAFKKRFGLTLTVNADLSGQESQKFNQAVAEAKAGIPPTFDVMQGEPPVVLDLIQSGGIERIENWEALLAGVSPEACRRR